MGVEQQESAGACIPRRLYPPDVDPHRRTAPKFGTILIFSDQYKLIFRKEKGKWLKFTRRRK
jgi:hypothetical protein